MSSASLRRLALFIAAIPGVPFEARSETETATLDISAIVPVTCTVGEVTVDLGAVKLADKAEVVTRSPIAISCQSETAFRISVDENAPTFLVSKDGNSRIPYSASIVGEGPTAMVEIRAKPTGNEPPGLYSNELLLKLDW